MQRKILCAHVYICIHRTTLEKELRRIINDERGRWGRFVKNVEKDIWCMWMWRLFQIRSKTKGMCVERRPRKERRDHWRVGQEDKVWRKGIYEVLWLKLCLYCSVLPKASVMRWRIKCSGVQTKCTPLLEQCCKPPEILQLLPVASLMSWDYFINQTLKHNRVERVGTLYKDEIEL